MKTLTFTLIFAIITFSGASGQIYSVDTLAQTKIQQLDFLTGQWAGAGWMMGRDGQKHEFDQTEDIQFKLDSTAILIEGLGSSKGEVIHHAMAIIRFDKETDHFSFNSFLANGMGGSFKAELADGKLYWYPRENMRYIIEINEKGQWLEIGEMNRGDQWFQFFEMTLEKK